MGELRFTDHAVIRYVERHIDESAVLALRRRGFSEHEMATYLRTTHADAIRGIVGRVRGALDRRSSQFINVMCGTTFTVVLGRVPVVIAGDRCITVLPSRHVDHTRAA